MIATFNQNPLKDGLSLSPTESNVLSAVENDKAIDKIKNFSVASLLLPNRIVTHHPHAGLNPIVDAAGFLLSSLGKLKQATSYRHLNQLQKELIQEISSFQETVKRRGYHSEYIMICRYTLCAAFDDLITNTSWGGQGQWDSFSLLAAFNQDAQHQDKFFTIMERTMQDPGVYIDLMELMYICLSMGYKGQYRSTEYNQFQLEQITNNLYKHIRAYRGGFSKTLSPALPKTHKTKSAKENSSLLLIFFVTACVMMTIFVSLGYLMDIISNEAYQPITQIETSVSNETFK